MEKKKFVWVTAAPKVGEVYKQKIKSQHTPNARVTILGKLHFPYLVYRCGGTDSFCYYPAYLSGTGESDGRIYFLPSPNNMIKV